MEPGGLGYHALQWAALNNRDDAAQYILEVRHSPCFLIPLQACAATYSGSGNTCFDFFQVVPNTPTERVRELLATAWAHDLLTTLKLMCNLRGVRGTGKSDKEGFYAAAL
ncbi:hypothetical protein QYE76_012403 [Lolium multiflorum]|uniref:DUF2828 domain-containing protein n=1 Tax=Lolium multiflorum TaxID=4521 RepID=A0AAD8TX49_LOLMU|nr:hypothetical protein QYE76_012403 [Lolium multiflorum]